MKIGEIEAVRQEADKVITGAGNGTYDEALDALVGCVATLDHLTTRLSEVERERDEARAWHQASQEALADQLEARSKLEAKVARVTKERDEARALNTGFAMTLDEDRQDHEEEEQHLRAKVTELEAEVARLTDNLTQTTATIVERDLHLTQARADLATLRAAVDEAVDALKAYDDATPEHGDDCRVGPYYHCTCDLRVAHEKARELRGRLRNLTKPDTPSERIMSDKDRENPVEGAHPTQPEGEDALVAVAREMTLLDGIVRTDNQKAAIRAGRAGQTASEDFYDRLRTALASRGLVVRGEGVERG